MMIKTVLAEFRSFKNEVMLYKSPDNRFCLHLESRILDEMLKYLAEANDRETGGILIGSYNQNRDTATVTRISGPPSDSVHGYTWFKRGTKGLQQLLFKFWKQKEYYLGEWHYHPNASARPSSVDKTQMKEIADTIQYHCPEPILVIIGGSVKRHEIKSFVLGCNGKLLELYVQEL